MDNEQLIAEILEISREDIKVAVRKQVMATLTESISYSVTDSLRDIAATFVKQEMNDEIIAMLHAAKPDIIEAMRSGIVAVGAQLAQCLVAQAMINLEINSYKSRDILKQIFA